MEIFAQVILFAVLVEAVVEGIKSVKEDGRINSVVALSMLVSLIASLAFDIDLFAMAGFSTAVPYIGAVLSSVIISRGSNYVSDIVSKFTA